MMEKRKGTRFLLFYRAIACNVTRGIAKACLSVLPSVCLKRVHCDKTKETCAHMLIPHERIFILVFRHVKWLVGTPPCTGNFGPNWLRWSNNAIFARSAAAVTPSE